MHKPRRFRPGPAGFSILRRRGDQAFGFFGGTMESFAAFATRNFTTFLAGILIDSPVRGLRPVRALRSTRTRRPRPGSTKTPFFFTSAIAMLDRQSSIPRAVLLLTSQLSARDL